MRVNYFNPSDMSKLIDESNINLNMADAFGSLENDRLKGKKRMVVCRNVVQSYQNSIETGAKEIIKTKVSTNGLYLTSDPEVYIFLTLIFLFFYTSKNFITIYACTLRLLFDSLF